MDWMAINDSLRFNGFKNQQMRFYLTNPAPCPYLPGKVERKVFTNLVVDNADGLNELLTHHGFRRSQTIAYRPSCASCNACQPVRIRVKDFVLTKSRRRVINRNAGLVREPQPPRATREQFRLLKRYLRDRHVGGGMAEMSMSDFAAMSNESPIQTVMFEYRESDAPDAALVAGSIIDILPDGLSMVYTYFDPDRHAESLGTYLILDHVRLAQELEVPYLYLGYWVEGSAKMDYKSRFEPLEILQGGAWVPFESRKTR